MIYRSIIHGFLVFEFRKTGDLTKHATALVPASKPHFAISAFHFSATSHRSSTIPYPTKAAIPSHLADSWTLQPRFPPLRSVQVVFFGSLTQIEDGTLGRTHTQTQIRTKIQVFMSLGLCTDTQ